MPVSVNRPGKLNPSKPKKKRQKRPPTVLKNFFGNLKLPDGRLNKDELYTAFLTLDIYQLSDKEIIYVKHLFKQLIKLIEAMDIMRIALHNRRKAAQTQKSDK